MNRDTFDLLLPVLGNRLVRQNTVMRNYLSPKKVLACGLLRLAHGDSYESIGPFLKVGTTSVIDACQDVVEALYDLRNEYIKFPATVAETMRYIDTFRDNSWLPNIVYCFSRFVSVWPASEAVDGPSELCSALNKFWSRPKMQSHLVLWSQ